MASFTKKGLISISLLFLALLFLFFYVKIMAYRHAIIEDSLKSNGDKCELVTYTPDYRPYGGVGRVLRMFSNQSFFIVYDIKGNKLKSSAWYFWQDQFSDLVAPEWHGEYAVYPTSNGWEKWHVPECG